LAKPVVDRLERDLAGRIPVVRIDLASREGSLVASHYAVQGIPTLVVVDGEGKAVLRQVGRLKRDGVLEVVVRLEDSRSSCMR